MLRFYQSPGNEMHMIVKALKNRYIKDNFIFIAGTVLAGFLGYLFHFFVARKLSIAAYGEVQSVFAIVGMFGVFASGFSYFIMKYSSLFAVKGDYWANNEFVSYLNKKIIKVIFIIAAFLLAFSPLIKNTLHLQDIWGIIAGIIAVIFGTIAVAFQESLRAWQKFMAIMAIAVSGAAIKLIFGYGFAVIAGSASSVIFSLAISNIFGLTAAIYFWKKIKTESSTKKERKRWDEYILRSKIWKNAIQIFLFSFASAFVLSADILIVKIVTTPETAGYYGALSVLGKIILLLNMSVVGVALPRACQDGHQGKNLHPKIFLMSFFLMLAIGSLLVLIYYLIPGPLMAVLFGQKYQAVAGNLWLFGLMALILSLFEFEANLAFARHDFRIIYILLLTGAAMAGAIFKFHGSLGDIAVAASASLLAGYFLAAFFNFSNRNRKIFEPII